MPEPLCEAPPFEERCLCGKMVARLIPAGVEILCRRCKRRHLIRWQSSPIEQQPAPLERMRAVIRWNHGPPLRAARR